MTGEHWREVKSIAADAFDVPEHERAAFVDARCAANDSLRREVLALVASTISAAPLYEQPVMTVDSLRTVMLEAENASASFIGRRVGAYRLVAEIGRGGMGAAYLAERADDSFAHRAAVKLIKRGMDTDGILRRFLHERQILASLNHPNIATLLDGGTTDDRLPYFVMEYVDGEPIDRYCDGNRLTVSQRLSLFLSVCAAVEHAHDNRVVHRDLKPANILVTKQGVPKLLDFGIAKLLDSERALQTEHGSTLGRAMTTEYASPEQIRGEAVTEATDVYSLGVLLYELLTGIRPHAGSGLTLQETERAICNDPPRTPSRVVTEEAARLRDATPAALRSALSGDLDAIVTTALQKEPAHRYTSVRAFAEDVQRHIEGRPIVARGRRVSWRSLTRRMKPAVFAPAAALVVASTLVMFWSIAAGRTPRPPGLTSVAVLPITSSGPHEDLDVLAQGLTENAIRRLSRVSQLRVIARDSVYRYAGPDVDVRRAGRELGVQAVLTGRIRGGPDGFVLTVDLVDCADGTVLWTEQYERPVADMQFVQAELAQQIANRLRGTLSTADQARVSRSDSGNAEAYGLYLRGRYFWNKRTTEDFEKAVGYFTQAVGRDPSFALAYAGLSNSYGLLTEYHGAAASATYQAARDAATRALALDDALPEAHAALGYIRHFYEWDFVGAEAAYTRAIELDPTYATAHQWYAELLSVLGRHDEALSEIRRATHADPLSLIVNSVEAHLLYFARRYDEAIEVCKRVIEMDPNFPEVYVFLKRAYDEKGDYAEAVRVRQLRRRLLGLNANMTPALRGAATARDSRTYWRGRLQQELIEAKTEGLQPFEAAEIYAGAGDFGNALTWLERACVETDFMVLTKHTVPTLDPIRHEPRFRAVLDRSCAVAKK
jgi:eukaryotic-like serine/threonine-protein kinase